MFEELDLKIASAKSEGLITPRQTLPVTTCSRAFCSETSPKYCC